MEKHTMHIEKCAMNNLLYYLLVEELEDFSHILNSTNQKENCA